MCQQGGMLVPFFWENLEFLRLDPPQLTDRGTNQAFRLEHRHNTVNNSPMINFDPPSTMDGYCFLCSIVGKWVHTMTVEPQSEVVMVS
jgi:hypothetical protein